jgi:hypothetical protein
MAVVDEPKLVAECFLEIFALVGLVQDSMSFFREREMKVFDRKLMNLSNYRMFILSILSCKYYFQP